MVSGEAGLSSFETTGRSSLLRATGFTGFGSLGAATRGLSSLSSGCDGTVLARRLAGGRNWCGFLSSCRGVGSLAADDTDVMVVVVVDAGGSGSGSGSGGGSKLLTLSSLSSLESLLLLTIVAGVAVKLCPSLTNPTLRVAGTGGASVGSFGAGVSSGLRSDLIAALTDIHVVVGGGAYPVPERVRSSLIPDV